MANLPEMSFGHIGINVTNMEPMVKFYTEILGFEKKVDVSSQTEEREEELKGQS